jgi:signal transduction histidine kinase
LVADLLDLSAIESNILRLHRDWCDIAVIIDAARACAPMSEIDRIKIDSEPLPAVWADHDRIEQVLVNLIDNAIRHNPPDTLVVVGARPLGNSRVVLTVSDDGIGIHGASRAAGAGLGLSISRAIVTAHGGTLQLDAASADRDSVGTCWRIELPISGGDTAAATTMRAASDG